jgi:hypothetical protein
METLIGWSVFFFNSSGDPTFRIAKINSKIGGDERRKKENYH